jgi:hypothetical protein
VTSTKHPQNDADLEPPLDITRPFMDDNKLSISGVQVAEVVAGPRLVL